TSSPRWHCPSPRRTISTERTSGWTGRCGWRRAEQRWRSGTGRVVSPPGRGRAAELPFEGPAERLLGLVTDPVRNAVHGQVRGGQQIPGQVHTPVGQVANR